MINSNETFGCLMSPVPLLHNIEREIDKSTWGPFSITFEKEASLSWVEQKKLQQITTKLINSISAELQFKDLYLFPIHLTKPNTFSIDVNFIQSETDFLINFINTLKTLSINLLDIYTFPEHPNEFVQDDVHHHSEQTYKDFQNLMLLKEYFPPNDYSSLFKGEFTFSNDSIFPLTGTNTPHNFSLLKFICFFQHFLFKIPHLMNLLKKFSIEFEYFPYFIESFTVEFIPSFTHHHNSLEKLGDTILNLCIVSDVIRSLPDQPLYYINHKYNKSISNGLFNTIGFQNGFQNCIIGPIDEDKVPADCFEALCGSIFRLFGYEKLVAFWRQRIFDIDDGFIEKNQLSKTIQAMKLNLRNEITDIEPSNTMPPFATNFLETYVKSKDQSDFSLHYAAKDAFTQGTEIQQKCKMIGAAFIKAMISKNIFSKMTKDDDLLLIEVKAKKDSVQDVARKIGFPSSRQLKIFIGGLFLTNGYDAVEDLIQEVIIPHFDLLPRRRRRHRRLVNENDPQ